MVYAECVVMRTALLTAVFAFVSVITASGQGVEGKCPEISVTGPYQITLPGDVMFFRADIPELDSRGAVTYEWKVSNGQITDGQGTNLIRVQTTREDEGTNVTATVTVKGLPKTCPDQASEVAGVATLPCIGSADEYGRIPWPDEQGRLDNLMLVIRNNPKSVAFIRMHLEAGEKVEDAKKHAIRILKHIKWRDEYFDPGRLRFAIEKRSERHSTAFYIVLDGAEMPSCGDGCTLLNGKNIYP